jgi:hypothetical protein
MRNKIAAVVDRVSEWDRDDQMELLDALISVIETGGNTPPEWHLPLVRKDLAEHRRSPDDLHSLEDVLAEADQVLARIRGDAGAD